jgi:hypothetical protein
VKNRNECFSSASGSSGLNIKVAGSSRRICQSLLKWTVGSGSNLADGVCFCWPDELVGNTADLRERFEAHAPMKVKITVL